MTQKRAARTRQAMLDAAAEEIGRHGYHGASLAGISKAGGMSMGALTFHFPTKDRIVTAIQLLSQEKVDEVLAAADAADGPALLRLRNLIIALVELIERESVVRAAARLAYERRFPVDWTETWLPRLNALVEQARAAGDLVPDADPEIITAFAVSAVYGRHFSLSRGADGARVLDLLTRMLDLILGSLSTGGAGTGAGAAPATGHAAPGATY